MQFKAILPPAYPEPIRILSLQGGANNRVFKLDFEARESLVLKEYFQHPADLRPRLQSEFSFLEYANKAGIQNIPRPLLKDIKNNRALYSFVSGRPVVSSDIDDSIIDQAVFFFLHLNKEKNRGQHLPHASEACFCLKNYLNITALRIERFKGVVPTNSLEKDMLQFLKQELIPQWLKLQERTCKAALHLGFSLTKNLTEEERCISPSDFGFHNALLEEGALFFIDFEYAGWDDPCKTICDLFCQPRIPIPEKYFCRIAHSFASTTSSPEKCLSRLELIRPLIQMRWCCTLLNGFSRVGKSRRQFSQSEELAYLEQQLCKARDFFNKI